MTLWSSCKIIKETVLRMRGHSWLSGKRKKKKKKVHLAARESEGYFSLGMPV